MADGVQGKKKEEQNNNEYNMENRKQKITIIAMLYAHCPVKATAT